MNSLWNDNKASEFADDLLALRVYSSRLLGGDPSLVLHGGGNTSVKTSVSDLFGDEVDILYVKGSGWDLATIEPAGFAPVRMETLHRMAELSHLSDQDMVKNQRTAMLDVDAPAPSVEAILHALIPFTFVDHTHADAVVTISNSPDGKNVLRHIYGPNMLMVPYVMPGFILAKTVYEMTRDIDWEQLDGMVLLNHGVFTFAHDAKDSYERHISIVSSAEEFIAQHSVGKPILQSAGVDVNLSVLSELRQLISHERGHPVLASVDTSAEAVSFANRPHVADLASRGLLTPDHVIRTKRVPIIVSDANIGQKVAQYREEYEKTFQRYSDKSMTQLDPAPRWAVWEGVGTVALGTTTKELQIIDDIKRHTIRAIEHAENLGGWTPLDEKEIFDVEYWELEQAKLRRNAAPPALSGKIALVTGGASGIGFACVSELMAQGAVVASLDVDPEIVSMRSDAGFLGVACDVTDHSALRDAVDQTVRHYGGIDIVIMNAGIFPASQQVVDIDPDMWDKSISVNLTSQQRLMQAAIPYLRRGIDPAVVIIASKNVPAPGAGASAYSVAKAGVTQLGRVAALELAGDGIRVNMLHPNAVFDTALWTPELLQKRADAYGISADEYKTRNLLNVEVRSVDVARMACAMVGPLFSRTTGAQLPIDGGNERVI